MSDKVLFLDDDENRHKKFKRLCSATRIYHTKTARETIEKLQSLIAMDVELTEIWLDHDLGGETYADSGREDTGMEVVRWLCTNPKPELKCPIYVHSLNNVAAPNMVSNLLRAGYQSEWIPFNTLVIP
jgi:hypothetical protein